MTNEDLQSIRTVIADRAPCSGPMTTFEGDRAVVGILCDRDRFATVIVWLATMERQVPELLDEVAKLGVLLAEACDIAERHITNDNSAFTDESLDRLAAIRADGAKPRESITVDGLTYGEHMIRELREERDRLQREAEHLTALTNTVESGGA